MRETLIAVSALIVGGAFCSLVTYVLCAKRHLRHMARFEARHAVIVHHMARFEAKLVPLEIIVMRCMECFGDLPPSVRKLLVKYRDGGGS